MNLLEEEIEREFEVWRLNWMDACTAAGMSRAKASEWIKDRRRLLWELTRPGSAVARETLKFFACLSG
jgi:hypothetical protein